LVICSWGEDSGFESETVARSAAVGSLWLDRAHRQSSHGSRKAASIVKYYLDSFNQYN